MSHSSSALHLFEPAMFGVPSVHRIHKVRRPLQILLVEDEESDIALTEHALETSQLHYRLDTLKNGRDVMAYLHLKGRPDMLLLDLSMPQKDGFEVLAELAGNDAEFADVPVVILTGDTHSNFLTHSYDLNIPAYITKPCTSEKIREALRAVRKKRS